MGTSTLASGHGTLIEFIPVALSPTTIFARAVGEFGLFQDVAQTCNVAASGSAAEAGVNWSKLVFAVGENLVARIVGRDSRNAVPSRIVWALYRNGQLIFNGEGPTVNYTGTMTGQYRIKGIAYCIDGAQLGFDSTAFVTGSVNVRHTLPVPDEGGTAVYIGAVYTQNIIGGAGTATTLPYQIGSSTESIFLLPGTTHWMFDLDPDGSAVDDEVVVRTQKGNWCLNGLAGGLAGEDVGYDYGYMPTLIPAPVNNQIIFTADFFKVHGLQFNSFNSRVRIKCYRRLAGGIYRYERCAYSNHPGGEGRRTRRWAALFTQMDIQTGEAVVGYATPNTTSVPLMSLSTSGTPNPVPGYSGLFYTDSNLYACYEADGQPDLWAKAISAIETVRPCCVSFLTFNHSKPVINHRVKRVYGKIVVFLLEGAVFEGSYVNIKLHTWKDNQPFMLVSNGGASSGRYDFGGFFLGKPYYGVTPWISGGIWWDSGSWNIQTAVFNYYFSIEDVATPDLVVNWQLANPLGQPLNPNVAAYDWAVPVTSTYYANEGNTLLKVGELVADITDYQFDETGLMLDFVVDETGAVTGAVPNPVPTLTTSPDYIYSPVYNHSVSYDGACYTKPTYVSFLDDNAVLVTPIGGCQDPLCGPAAIYCYTALDAPAENIAVPQPFGFPAPYISNGTNPARCYGSPVGMSNTAGTNVSLAEFTGSQGIELWSFTGTSLCGYSYLYADCQTNYAPCAANTCSLIIVYPVSGSPHANVEYGGRCYYFTGSTQTYGTRTVVAASSVNPVAGCADPACNQYNANGSVVVYNDMQTSLEVPVLFEHLNYGTAHYGAAAQKLDNWSGGLVDGSLMVVFKHDPNVLIYTSIGTGSMMFEFGLSGVRKQIVVDHAGVQQVYSPGIGGSRQSVALQPGDRVYLRITDPYGRLPLQCRGKRTLVRWHALLFLPRLFDTVVVPYTGSTAINALGFCAYTNQGVYTFYGTLPFTGSMTGPVNPDSLVTVLAGTQEYSLVSARAVGDVTLHSLGVAPYAGQVLNGPFTFKFYAAREAFGAHGEMDVWFNTNGTFPGYLRAGQYDALEFSGTSYRKDAAPTDTDRNSYAVVDATTAGSVSWPCVYVDQLTGQVITANVNVQTVIL